MNELKESALEKGIEISFDDNVLFHVAEKSYSEKYGARNMARFIQANIEDKIANAILSDREMTAKKFHLQVESDQIQITQK